MKIILEVPYFSQHTDVENPEWKANSCAIVCLKMAMEFLKEEHIVPSIDDLIKEGVLIGAHTSSVGWIHSGLTRLAHNHNFLAYNEEFKSVVVDLINASFGESAFTQKIVEKGILKIYTQLQDGFPVIVSCPKKWSEVGTMHQVLLVGVEVDDDNLKGFYYHEPDTKDNEGNSLFVDLETFANNWRKFAIFVGK